MLIFGYNALSGLLFVEILNCETASELRVPYLDRNAIQCAMRISPRLKIKDSNDSIRKWVHRNVAAMLGVPDYTAYREKDMAQSGSGVHGLIQNVAANYFEGEKVERDVGVKYTKGGRLKTLETLEKEFRAR
jgi:asparagine synthetase B (glutamine-hydrolysing)